MARTIYNQVQSLNIYFHSLTQIDPFATLVSEQQNDKNERQLQQKYDIQCSQI